MPLGSGVACASTAYGTINNFDTVNDTGVECHGFEIEIEDIHSQDITYTYNWNHYGTPQITEDNSSPLHPKVVVRYASAKTTNGTWAAYTAIPSGPIAPTDGHRFTDPSVNFGGEHFGVGYRGTPTNFTYHWLVDNGAGGLVRGPAVNVATPTFTYIPPAAGAPARVQAVIEPPPAPPVLEFGPASWVKEIRTASHNGNEVKLRDLVSDDPDDPSDKNWRNGEPDEVEVEWQLLQTEFNKANGGANGELQGAPEDLAGGDEVITRRYEFYKYLGPLDDETGEAKAERVGPDGIHGVGVKTINGVEVDLSTVVIVGEYLGSQMSAFDVDAPVGLIEHVQDGVVDEPYPTRTVVIAGNAPFTATNWGVLPAGMTFNRVSGELSGTPTEAGVFSFTVEANADNAPVVRRTYTLTIAEAGAALPPRSTVDTVASPLDRGTTAGDGTYTNGTTATVTAMPAAGFVFANWTENGKVVSSSASYTFTNVVNRSLAAYFLPEPPRLFHSAPQPGALACTWPTNASGYVLQRNTNLNTRNWANVTNVATIVGTNSQITISPLTGPGSFFRLIKP
ncbi:MAG: putative Ig domain-containing protein [Verrucomicrobiota bacterium]